MNEHLEELATRLFVAYTSEYMGIKSMDYFRKHYIEGGECISDGWIELAKIVETLGIKSMEER